jgi:hypothetical protein
MAVTIGQDAVGNAIVTGDNNQTFVFYGVEKLPPDLLADILNGRKRAADIPEAVPLPALTLAIDFEDETRAQWKIAARRATGVPVARGAAAPWRRGGMTRPSMRRWTLSGGCRACPSKSPKMLRC